MPRRALRFCLCSIRARCCICGTITGHVDRVMHALHLPFGTSEPEAGFAERLEAIARNDQCLANLLRIAICTAAHRGPRFQSLVAYGSIARAASALIGFRRP